MADALCAVQDAAHEEGEKKGRADAFREAADLLWEWCRHGSVDEAEEWGEKLREHAREESSR